MLLYELFGMMSKLVICNQQQAFTRLQAQSRVSVQNTAQYVHCKNYFFEVVKKKKVTVEQSFYCFGPLGSLLTKIFFNF